MCVIKNRGKEKVIYVSIQSFRYSPYSVFQTHHNPISACNAFNASSSSSSSTTGAFLLTDGNCGNSSSLDTGCGFAF